MVPTLTEKQKLYVYANETDILNVALFGMTAKEWKDRIHTDSIKENIVPKITEKQKQFVYANEADVINVALFGMTAKEWRDKNPDLDGNIRDSANSIQLLILYNLENLNSEMIAQEIEQKIRLERLNTIAKSNKVFCKIVKVLIKLKC